MHITWFYEQHYLMSYMQCMIWKTDTKAPIVCIIDVKYTLYANTMREVMGLSDFYFHHMKNKYVL